MVSYTDNHDLQLWADNEEPWEHRTDMETLDTAVEIRDLDANRTNYTPKDGAKFTATDTGTVYLGDGSTWSYSPVSATLGITEREPQAMTVRSTQTAVLQLRQFEQFNTDQLSIEDGGSIHIRKLRYNHDI